jgi:hypothetical protein
LHKDAPVFRPIRQTAIIRSPDPWHVESNAWSAKPMVGVYPEWGRALMTYPATSWTAFAMRAPMSRNPCWHRPGDLPIEQASKLTLLSLADEVIE